MAKDLTANDTYEIVDENEEEQKHDPISQKIDLILLKIAHKKSNKKLDNVLIKIKRKKDTT